MSPFILLTFLIIQIISIYSSCDQTCDVYVCLTALDFETGTYRIKESGKYCLTENIVFNPLNDGNNILNPNSDFSWFPNDELEFPGCDSLGGGSFALGFFSAISIEVDNVEIDLNNFEIKQHPYFYIQQRFYAHIEINKSPFLEGTGPTNFGSHISAISNIYIHHGRLGLSSHHGIHANEANNVKLKSLNIYDFEVGGIHFNGFTGVRLINIRIGPSATNVQPAGYYSNAKFLSIALNKLLTAINEEYPNKADDTKLTFDGGRTLSIQQIYNNLIKSMDIVFRYWIGESTDEDESNPLYTTSISLYNNPSLLPDGSALYGIVMHSYDVAINGYGSMKNEENDGEDVLIRNVLISDLSSHLNEVPAVYFDKCDDPNSITTTVLKGPFGDIMDIRKMVGIENEDLIDNGNDFNGLQYIGNPLSDAQIALGLIGKLYNLDYGSSGMLPHSYFLEWALDEYEGITNNVNELPECISCMCNGDIMLHTNKGVIGIRFDLIENIRISNLKMNRLYNKSPISSYACKNYTGRHDGGNPTQLDLEGSMGTDVAGLTLYGGDLTFIGGNNIFKNIKSYYGSATGFHLMHDAVLNIEDDALIEIKRIFPGQMIDTELLNDLIENNKYPYPNNFEECNIFIDERNDIGIIVEGFDQPIRCVEITLE